MPHYTLGPLPPFQGQRGANTINSSDTASKKSAEANSGQIRLQATSTVFGRVWNPFMARKGLEAICIPCGHPLHSVSSQVANFNGYVPRIMMVDTSYGPNSFLENQFLESPKRKRNQPECNERRRQQTAFLGKKGIVWQRRDGVPILGSRRVRRVLLAATFPEFYTTHEVDALHNLLDEAWTARCDFFGETNSVPRRHRLMWNCTEGQFESIRWVGSRSRDMFGVSPWWAGGIIYGLLNEMPQEYHEHIGAYLEVEAVIHIVDRVPKTSTSVLR
ncbi:hypothetical protein BT69DRAFT_1325570 [Atractiella rhizophila]|nr:hypothetical protein BT69DRAFT_1325570 [Atractiella rhizophila]